MCLFPVTAAAHRLRVECAAAALTTRPCRLRFGAEVQALYVRADADSGGRWFLHRDAIRSNASVRTSRLSSTVTLSLFMNLKTVTCSLSVIEVNHSPLTKTRRPVSASCRTMIGKDAAFGSVRFTTASPVIDSSFASKWKEKGFQETGDLFFKKCVISPGREVQQVTLKECARVDLFATGENFKHADLIHGKQSAELDGPKECRK